MGRRNYLIEGVSGAGKTAVGTGLQERGYQVIHGDRELAYSGDPNTGEPVTLDSETPSAEWRSEHHLWDLEKVRAYIANNDEEITFFCGSSRNHSKFVGLMDDVFILDVDRETMMKRIDERVAIDPSDFGTTQDERDLIFRLYETKQDIPRTGKAIDANQPLDKVIGDILVYIRA